MRLVSRPWSGSWSKTEREVLACPLEHGQDSFNTETALDGLYGRSWSIPADPVDCVYGRPVQRLSLLLLSGSLDTQILCGQTPNYSNLVEPGAPRPISRPHVSELQVRTEV